MISHYYFYLQGFNGGRVLLSNTENYGVYLAEALHSPTVNTVQFVNGITLTEENIGKSTSYFLAYYIQLEITTFRKLYFS